MKLGFVSLITTATALLHGCGEECGPGSAAADGLRLTTADGGLDVRFTALIAGANNDCPDPDAPAGVVSLTIAGNQAGDIFPITFCAKRPDRLADGVQQFPNDIELVDIDANGGACTYALLRTAPETGTASTSGMCKNGIDPKGFAFTVNANFMMNKTCQGQPVVAVAATLAGTASVVGDPR